MPVARRQLNFDFTKDAFLGFLDPLFTFTRASTATRINAAGLMVTEAANVPRFDYDNLTLACKGLLLEPQRTNLVLGSADMTGWSTNAATFTHGQPGPFTGVTSTRVTGGGQPFIIVAGLTVGVQYTLSCWTKNNAASATVFKDNQPEHALVALPVTALGWRRIFVTWTQGAGAGTSAAPNFVGGPFDFHAALFQLEVGAYATSYIPTVASTVTRATDFCHTTQMTPWAAAEGTLGLEFAELGLDSNAFRRVIDLGDAAGGGNVNTVQVILDTVYTSGGGVLEVFAGGVNQLSIQFAAVNGIRRLALAWRAGRLAYALNGGATVVVPTFTALPVATRLQIGNRMNTFQPFAGHLRKVIYLPYVTDDYFVQALSK